MPAPNASEVPLATGEIGAQLVPQLDEHLLPHHIGQRAVIQLSWGHNVILIQKIKDLPTRLWYARQVLEQGWSRDTLADPDQEPRG